MKNSHFVSETDLSRQRDIALTLAKEIIPRKLTFFVETFGCQMNVRDSETIKGWLSMIGYTEAKNKESADFVLYNTCCVRDHAEKRLMGNIGALKERKDENPGMIIAICGCMMQQEGMAKKLLKRFPHVNLIFGTNALHRFPEMLREVLNGDRVALTDRDNDAIAEGLPKLRDNQRNAFVNIMYGCDNYCSYCIVPYVRGHERSRRPEDIRNEIVSLVENGITEITLLGQNVNSYGNDGSTGIKFAELLRYVSDAPGLKRIRFMSSHPKDLNEDVMQAIASLPNVCHHVHRQQRGPAPNEQKVHAGTLSVHHYKASRDGAGYRVYDGYYRRVSGRDGRSVSGYAVLGGRSGIRSGIHVRLFAETRNGCREDGGPDSGDGKKEKTAGVECAAGTKDC